MEVKDRMAAGDCCGSFFLVLLLPCLLFSCIGSGQIAPHRLTTPTSSDSSPFSPPGNSFILKEEISSSCQIHRTGAILDPQHSNEKIRTPCGSRCPDPPECDG